MLACGCPGTVSREIKKENKLDNRFPESFDRSELSQWPIQLRLISPLAPYFNECDLLIAADCSAFSMGSFHKALLKNKKLAIACPKLDEKKEYVAKLSELLKHNTIYSLTVAVMSVPCCGALFEIVKTAVEESGKNIAIKKIVIDIEGNIF